MHNEEEVFQSTINNIHHKTKSLSSGYIKTIKRVKELSCWHRISPNDKVKSCRDAASRRKRLGHVGIPIFDELKSLAIIYYDKNYTEQYTIVHCRAHKRFDYKKITNLLNSTKPVKRLSNKKLHAIFDATYGTVNPFIVPKNLHQYFDDSVLRTYTAPHTMMTNAGDYRLAIEFIPKELIDSLINERPGLIQISSICQEVHKPSSTKPLYGIITGNGPHSGITLWRHLNSFVASGLKERFKGDLSYPQVIIHSVPEMGLSMELASRKEDVWQHLSRAILSLCNDGATHIALACHTTHYFTDKIREICESKAEFVSMAETVLDYIESEKILDLTIMGIPYVSDLDNWSAYRDLKRINTKVLNIKAREPMLELGYLIKKMTNEKDHRDALNKLHHVLRTGVKGANVLIALTEISVLLEHFPKKQKKIGDFIIIDALRLYAKHLAQIYLNYLSFDVN